MATAPSLFGANPEDIQQQRAAALNAEALQYAKLDPFQRATMGIYKGANQLGGAIGGMLGGQDPQMQRMQQRKQIVQGMNPNSLASIAESIKKAMAADDYPAAQELTAAYKDLEESQSKTALERQQAATSSSVARKNLLDSTMALQGQTDRVNTLTEAGIPAAQAQGIASSPTAFALSLIHI